MATSKQDVISAAAYKFEHATSSEDLNAAVQVIDLVRFVYGKPLDDKVLKILDNIDEDMSGTITLQEFCKKNKNYPSLLFPAFHMQVTSRDAPPRCPGRGSHA